MLFFLTLFYFMSAITGSDAETSMNCRAITCSSQNYNYAKCSVGPRERIVSIVVEQQHSKTACARCLNWGVESSYFWVDDGCRAKFKLCTVDYRLIACKSLECSSENYQKKRCTIPDADYITSVNVEKQLSRSECRKCQSYYQTEDAVYVKNGCRARFQVCYTRLPGFLL